MKNHTHFSLLKSVFLVLIIYVFSILPSHSQIAYTPVTNKKVSFGSYGRIGVDWSFVNGGSIGRRLNLNNMGSIGGRLEEQDYLELAPTFNFNPKEGDETIINVNLRFAVYSQSLSSFGNSSTSSLGGLTLAIPEMYAEARNIKGSGINVWVGSRLYNGPDIHIADHFYFNDHGGQGFGVEFKKSRFAAIFVSATDTTGVVSPYFYLNFKTGTPSAALRQRTVFIGEHDFVLNADNKLTVLGEFHRMADADSEVDNPVNLPENPVNLPEDPEIITNFPSDNGFVLGARLNTQFKNLGTGSFNDLAIRYGSGIANGGDGGVSKTYATYGAPDLDDLNFKGAYSWSIVDQTVLNYNEKNTLHAYVIFTSSKGGADSNHLANSYFGDEVFNKKIDLTVGSRNETILSDYFRLLTELHYSQRKDGVNPIASMMKFSLSPVYVPTGETSTWARPHLRFVVSVARYNDFAKETLYSPYLQYAGPEQWGSYFGVKAEWWIN